MCPRYINFVMSVCNIVSVSVTAVYGVFFCLSAAAEGNHIKMFMRGRPITMFIPSDVENYEDVRTELPAERLKLEWVYPSLVEVVSIVNNKKIIVQP